MVRKSSLLPSSPAPSISRFDSWLPVLPAIVGPFLLLAPVLLGGQALFWGTPALQFVPWWDYAFRTVQSGRLPLWNPLVGMGAPLAANYQAALFYPPTWVYFILHAMGGVAWLAWGQALLVALHLVWSGLGMVSLARRLGLGYLAQAIAGLAFGLSAYLVSRAGFLSINAAAAWTPWILWAVSRQLDDGGRSETGIQRFFPRPVSIYLILILAMQLLAGHAQTTWYSWILAGLWAGYWAWFRTDPERGGFKSWLKTLGLAWARLASSVALAVGLAAIQLLPTAEYLLGSQRSSAVEYEAAMAYSYWPWRLLTLLVPNLFGSPAQGDYWGYGAYWEDALYIGLLPALLALGVILGLFRKRDRQKYSGLPVFLLVVSLFALVLGLGQNTLIFPFLYRYIPTFSMFQAPTRWLLLAEVALALLAGLGAESWRRPAGRGLYWTRLGTAGAFAITLGAGLTLLLGQVEATFIRATALAGLWGLGAGGLSLLAPPKDSIEAPDRQSTWRWAVIAIVLADLWVAGWGLNPGVSLDFYRDQAATATEVKSLVGEGRLFLPYEDEQKLKFKRFLRFKSFLPLEDWRNLRAVLLPNLGMLDEIPALNNFDPLVPGRYATLTTALRQDWEGLPSQTQGYLLDALGVGAVETVDRYAFYGVSYEPTRLRPALASFYHCSRSTPNGQTALDWMLAPGENELDGILVLEAPAGANNPDCLPGNGDPQPLSIKRIGPGEVLIDLPGGRTPGWVVFKETFYPGWKAYIDGEQANLVNANFVFMAVAIPDGEPHQLEFVYRPLSFYAGLAISLLMLSCLLVGSRCKRI